MLDIKARISFNHEEENTRKKPGKAANIGLRRVFAKQADLIPFHRTKAPVLSSADSIIKEDHGMFDNIGSKIKGLAKVITWLGIILSVIAGIVQISGGSSYYGNSNPFVISGILTIVLGSLAAWISSFLLYGFGELVENSSRIADQLGHIPQRGNMTNP
jgi:hypothetical protein